MNGKTLVFFNEFPLKTLYARWFVDMREALVWQMEYQAM